MGKFKDWFKKLFKSSQGSVLPPPARGKTNASEVEQLIERFVLAHVWKCENLCRLNPSAKYWVAVIKAVCFAESSFNPYETYWEKDLGVNGYDSTTNMKYMSEGLMQLSYSDAIYYQCEFDIEGDRKKPSDDKSKTIFDIEKNIRCGLKILDKMVFHKGTFIFNKGNYWAVLKPENKRHKIFLGKFNEYLGVL